MFKRAILVTLNRLGYTLARSDWFEAEKAHVAAEIMAARERANEEIERVTAAQAERANEEIERVTAVHADRTIEEIERVLVGQTDARSDLALGGTSGDFKACRPLSSIVQEFENWAASRPPVNEMLRRIEGSAAFTQHALPYFMDYPAHSFISAYSRAYLYSFVRALKPLSVVEIGTFFVGTTEVIARALVENGSGVVHTIDPYGALRAPPVIAAWPQALRRITHFHPVTSMSFFSRSAEIKRRFDLVFVDGNHDLEFALFDIMMAPRLITPLGLIFVDNTEQRGPCVAAQIFMRENPEWTLLGTSYDPDRPFATEERFSV